MHPSHVLSAQRVLSVFILLALLAGCASTPRVPMDAGLRSSLTSVAIVQTPDPERYYVLGADSITGGSLLYLFGAIGGGILGGMMAAKAEGQADALTKSIAVHTPKLATTLVNSLKADFEQRGVSVEIIEAPPVDQETKQRRYGSVQTQAQVIVEPVIGLAGYQLRGGTLKPLLSTRIRLLDAKTQAEKFADVFVYGEKVGDRAIPALSGPTASYPDLAKLFADGEGAALALTEGARELGRTVVRIVKP